MRHIIIAALTFFLSLSTFSSVSAVNVHGSVHAVHYRCNACDGTGVCWVCHGNGKVNGATCSYCHGSGKCWFCSGTGKI